MAVVRLAFSNVWRRLSRSVLTLFAMAVAAMVLTSGMSMSQGVARRTFEEYSKYLQGDILIYSPGFVGASPVTKGAERVVRHTLADSGFNTLLRFYPDLRTKGYYAEEDWAYEALSADTLAEIASTPGVVKVSPHLVMPAAAKGSMLTLMPAPTGYEEYISEGTVVSESAGLLKVVVNAYGSIPDVKLHELITLQIPTYSLDHSGIPFVDSSQPSTAYEAEVVGMVSWPTRAFAWQGPADVWMSEQGYVHAPDVYLTEQAWHAIWQAQSHGLPYGATAVSVTIDQMEFLYTRTNDLRAQYPHLAILPISQVVQQALRSGLIDKFYQAPRSLWAGELNQEPSFASQDFAKITGVLLFVNAGMLLASQMLAAVSSRRKEIGILKAIGARQREVITLILVEALVLAIIGAAAGFLLVRLAALHQAITNGVAWFNVVRNALVEMAIVLGLTSGLALVFGALPAWRVARLTVMEVFRNE